MTVLLVLVFFATFIAIDYARERRQLAREAAARLAAEPPVEPAWVAGYLLPEDRQYHRGHTWARAVGRDTVVVGLDDFARRLVGSAERAELPARGDWLHQGGKGFTLGLDGRTAQFVAPVEGEVVEVNPEVRQRPSLATDDPYGRGWVFKVKAANLGDNLRNLLSGRLARRWMEDCHEALELRLMALSGSVLQDGGEPVAEFARHLSPEDWKRLTGEFFLS
jgi:glycine cleavage system H protein